MRSIVLCRQRAVEIFREFGLAPFREILTESDFASVSTSSGCQAKRRRCFTPEVIVWTMMLVAAENTSMIQGLSLAWGIIGVVCPWLAGRPCVQEESFCEARQKLSLSFWRTLWVHLLRKYEERFGAQLLWKGLRVFAIDGTEADVPNAPALVRFFTRPKTKLGESKAPQGRLVAVCSIFSGFCLDFVFMSRRFSEHIALQHLIRHFREHDLILLDRGFFSYAAIHKITLRKAHFLMRISKHTKGYAKKLKKLGEDDWMVEFRPSQESRKKQPQLPEVLMCRMLHYHINGFRHSWLLTSLLDPQAFSREELVTLYHRRWRIETIYREWKHTLHIQNLRSHTPIGIRKEIHAQLLLSNLTRWVMTDAAQGTEKTPVEFSFTSTLTAMRNAFRSMARANPSQRIYIYQQLLNEIRSHVIRQRPGRSYPRYGDGKPKNKGHEKFLLPSRNAMVRKRVPA